jgi:hypothetical protein
MSGTPPVYVYGAFSDYLETALLAHAFLGTVWTPPAGLWVALYAVNASDTGPAAEPPSAAGYARVPVTFAAGTPGTDGSSTVWNSAVVQFATATALWGQVVSCGIHDAVSAGNMLAQGPLSSIKVIDIGDAVRFSANQLVIGLQ